MDTTGSDTTKQKEMSILGNISDRWRAFWRPIPPPDDVYVKWELRPVNYRLTSHADGRVTWREVEIEEEEITNYGGTD
jgi:hypothetical protein